MAILNQKKIHDKRVFYENFNAGDNVYVYFPVKKKTGHSEKITSFWRGPFQVIEKLSDVLLKINCGRNGIIQVVHIDRVPKVRKWILRGESQAVE